jgi:hypothetical protein
MELYLLARRRVARAPLPPVASVAILHSRTPLPSLHLHTHTVCRPSPSTPPIASTPRSSSAKGSRVRRDGAPWRGDGGQARQVPLAASSVRVDAEASRCPAAGGETLRSIRFESAAAAVRTQRERSRSRTGTGVGRAKAERGGDRSFAGRRPPLPRCGSR